MKRNIVMSICYEGTRYHGFQRQSAESTIQGCLEHALQKITQEPVQISGTGRTDAGVHAQKQFIQFQTESKIPCERWVRALNQFLPSDIQGVQAWEMPLAFHVRKTPSVKTYRYTIRNCLLPDIFQAHMQLHIPYQLNHLQMESALKFIIGTHTFTTFTKHASEKTNHVRTIYKAWIDKQGPLLHIFIQGNGFLQYMVRIIVGTIIQIGCGKHMPIRIQELLQKQDRRIAGPTAPPHGLMLWNVQYSDYEMFDT